MQLTPPTNPDFPKNGYIGEVWNRQEGEPEEAYARFVEYRDNPLYERTFAEMARHLGLTSHAITMQAKRYNWKQRVLAFDQDRNQKQLVVHSAGLEAAQRSYYEWEQTVAKGLKTLVENSLATAVQEAKENKLTSLDATRAVTMIKEATNLMRRSLSLPTNFLSKASDEPDFDEDEVYLID